MEVRLPSIKGEVGGIQLCSLTLVGGTGVAITRSILCGEGGCKGGGIDCSIPPIETKLGGGSADVEESGSLVGEGAVDRVLGVVLN